MTTLRVSLAEHIGIESAVVAATRQSAESWEDRAGGTLTASERALRRAGLRVCGKPERIVDHPPYFYAMCTSDDITARRWRREHVRCKPRRRCAWWLPLGGGRGLTSCEATR